ncbi:hypothetical protein [Aquimarina longa]|uniref:hypothetical protein n=1 Tax=Aquimarina longa TaxID=1080221 RepID=UPI00078081F3|nr:hypothetical protein [Aquimarina longa]
MRKTIFTIGVIIGMLNFGFSQNQIHQSNGNVGIGTENPEAKLHVKGPTRFTNGRLTQSGDMPNDNNALFINTSTSGYGIYSKGGLDTHYAFHFENQAGESIILGNGNGNIGIGVTAPQAKLHVKGPTRFTNGRLTQSGDMPNDNNALFINTSTSGYGIYSKGGLGTHYAFHFENQAGESIILGRGNGNIGIGTIDPKGWKLAVNGKIRAKEIKVETEWADFVFYDDYKLPTLIDVENHIKEKGHLKDIPSAEEVKENGIYLGEMDSKLLQKIEELTLYTIQQQKEIKKQAKKIENLELLNNKLLELQSRLAKLESKK